MTNHKKILFIIVEGPSDETAIGSVLSHIYEDTQVFVHVVGGDITTQTPEGGDIAAKVSAIVKNEAAIYHWRASDIARIIHIVDTDGAFVPEDAVIQDPTRKHIRYYENQIRTPDKKSVLERNVRKQQNLKTLIKSTTIWRDVPYQVYYMSCNLDHVLYGQLNMPDSAKVDTAYAFARTYRKQPEAFIEYMTDSPFSVDGDFEATWNYIKKGTRSLERHSNLHLALTGAGSDRP